MFVRRTSRFWSYILYIPGIQNTDTTIYFQLIARSYDTPVVTSSLQLLRPGTMSKRRKTWRSVIHWQPLTSSTHWLRFLLLMGSLSIRNSTALGPDTHSDAVCKLTVAAAQIRVQCRDSTFAQYTRTQNIWQLSLEAYQYTMISLHTCISFLLNNEFIRIKWFHVCSLSVKIPPFRNLIAYYR